MIERFATYRSAIHGRLWIDGQYVCDTLENEPCCLQEGSYPLVIKFVESEPVSYTHLTLPTICSV